MTAIILAFPGVDIANVPPRPMTIADLPEGAKALVIRSDGGRYLVEMEPAITEAEKAARLSFTTHGEAVRFARTKSTSYPALYRLIIDNAQHPILGGAA